MRMNLFHTLFLGVSLAFIGCGDHDHDHDHESHASPEEEACEHMADGPASSVTAGADSMLATDTDADAWTHKRVDLTLSAGTDGFEGFLTFEATEAGDYLFFVDGDASLTVAGASPESSAAVSTCSEVAQVHTFELEVGEHVVGVASTIETVRLVVEHSSEHSDH